MVVTPAREIWVSAARLSDRAGLYQIAICAGRITAIVPQDYTPQPAAIDLGGDWLSLGGVDLQINGALGLPFPNLTPDRLPQLQAICEYLWQQGIDAFLPTLVTSPIASMRQAIATIAAFLETPQLPGQAQILGVHLEGPFLNPDKRGAHPQQHLQPLTLANLQHLLDDLPPVVKLITLAPELDPTGEAIAYLQDRGIAVSLGHSQATAAETKTAGDRGATMVTHAFNAMPRLHHREPGLLGAALTDPRFWCGCIADGQHICPTMLEILVRAGRDRLFLVSDALAPLGLGDGDYPWDSRVVTVRDGTAHLEDGTLAGTTLPLLVGTQNLARWGICDPGAAIALATNAPRAALGLPGLAIGQPAMLLRWSWDARLRTLTWQRLQLARPEP
ncbi:N-acetylglucosamine-6-phosphate deacetylase [Rubidibacter lacunae KORDI 51-2]|uniref:N-acetylglucosamine-6-phosphate deacetylase n=1 Tax=Rubidibacter lacunae KORDI 51-2 TaxID=582515 RepID=U5D691_9CHRO|nr:N-acetylglucosamine-6-phosphate deacetylase [Rubidibacter lacunae KORDI 51-2]